MSASPDSLYPLPLPLPLPAPPPPTYGNKQEEEGGSSSSSSDDDATEATVTTAYGVIATSTCADSDCDSSGDIGNADDTALVRAKARARKSVRWLNRWRKKIGITVRQAALRTSAATADSLLKTDRKLLRLHHTDKLGISALMREPHGYSLGQIKRVLCLTRVRHLCERGGLCADDMNTDMWDAVIQNFKINRRHLKKYFKLVTFRQMLEAGLTASQLASVRKLEMNANMLALAPTPGLFTKADLALASSKGWRLKHWHTFALNYDTLLALDMQPDDYRNLMRIDPTRIAVLLNLHEPESEHVRALRARINLFY